MARDIVVVQQPKTVIVNSSVESPNLIQAIQSTVEVNHEGVQGPPGPPGAPGVPGGTRYTHIEIVAVTPWLIPHNLGYFPHVNVIINGEKTITDVYYPDENNVTIHFLEPQPGRAELI